MKIFILTIALCSFNVFSQDSEEYKKGFEAGKAAAATELKSAPKEEAKAGDHQISEVNRRDKKFEVAAYYGADYTLPTQQISFAYFTDPNSLIGLKFGSTARSQNDYRDTQINLSLFYKKFVGNSFYFSPEIVYLKLDTTESNYIFGPQGNEFYRGFGAGVRIGNQWMFKNFSIGCDWIGLGRLMVTTQNTENRTYYATLLNFYLGWAF